MEHNAVGRQFELDSIAINHTLKGRHTADDDSDSDDVSHGVARLCVLASVTEVHALNQFHSLPSALRVYSEGAHGFVGPVLTRNRCLQRLA